MKVFKFASALIMSTMTGHQALTIKAGTKEAALLQEGMTALAYTGSALDSENTTLAAIQTAVTTATQNLNSMTSSTSTQTSTSGLTTTLIQANNTLA